MGLADGLEIFAGVGVAVVAAVGFGVADAFGLSVGVGVPVAEPAAGVGVTVGLTKIMRIAPSSGTGETMAFFRVTRTRLKSTKRLTKIIMIVIAAIVFLRSSIRVQYNILKE